MIQIISIPKVGNIEIDFDSLIRDGLYYCDSAAECIKGNFISTTYNGHHLDICIDDNACGLYYYLRDFTPIGNLF